MGTNKNILEKSTKEEEFIFIEQPLMFKEPDMRIQDKYDEPCLKYVREGKS